MSSKAGTKNYVFSCEISGSLVPNISAGFYGVLYEGSSQTVYNPLSVTALSAAPGHYAVQITDIPGSGAFIPLHSNTAILVKTERAFRLDDNTYDTDSIYGRFLSSQTINLSPSSVSYAGPYAAFTGTDFIQAITVPTSLLGTEYGGDGVSLTGWTATVGSTTPLISTGSATITDTTNRVITISIARTVLVSSLLGSATSLPITFDVVGHSPTGLRRVLARFLVNLSLGVDTND